jgi:cyclase
MITPRIIARLDIKGTNLVKGIQFEGLRVLGNPGDFARHYYDSGADELLYIDVVASLYERANLLHIVESTSREVFIPLTVGGGLRSLEDIRSVLQAGADKVAVNTAAIRRPSFLGEAARRFGSSTLVVSIEAKRQPDGSYEAYVENGRQRTGLEAVGWARQAVEQGAGEVMVTSIDREGTGRGYDVALVRRLAEAVPVPVVACGGAGTPDHVRDVLVDGLAEGAAVASMLHYRYLRDHLNDVPAGPAAQRPVLPVGSSRIAPATVAEIKARVSGSGLVLRPVVM